MNIKKHIILQLLLVLLLAAAVLSGCDGSYMHPERALRDFSRQIEQGNFDNLTLTIYYRDIRSTVRFPFNIEDLVGGGYQYKIFVDGNELEEHIDLLRQISADALIPVAHAPYMDAMLYYVFEANGRKIFGFVPNIECDVSSMFINGVEFLWDDVFFDVIRPFLSEDELRLWDGPLMPE